MIRDMLFPQSEILADTAIDVAKGPSRGRAAVLYGGPHVF